MLILTRRRGEEIVIPLADGREIVISLETILTLGKARIGVQAPGDIPVHRREVLAKIVANGESLFRAKGA